ncbi:MAG: hypothetical protein HW421_1527 [Ignavibacteria bacterium]|nr:hypothetical protein [Ignavibacteria bacterium]
MKIIPIILCVIGIFGCSNSTDPNYNSYYDALANLEAKQAIALANEWRDSAPKITSLITTNEVKFEFPDGRKTSKSLPDSLMYIAIAPYINKTHECSTHYPSSCTGEINEKEFKITAKDKDNISITYFDGNITSLKHGFIELWLTRNKNIELKITYDNKSGQEIIPTYNDSRSCITTIMLK